MWITEGDEGSRQRRMTTIQWWLGLVHGNVFNSLTVPGHPSRVTKFISEHAFRSQPPLLAFLLRLCLLKLFRANSEYSQCPLLVCRYHILRFWQTPPEKKRHIRETEGKKWI